MSSVTIIAQALEIRLATLSGVDQSSVSTYTPPVETKNIALIIPPLGLESRLDRMAGRGSPLMQSHRIQCEFWVRVDKADLAMTMERSREIGLAAMRLLIQDQSLGGAVQSVGQFGPGSNALALSSKVNDFPITIQGMTFIVVTVTVGVIDYSDAD